MTISACCAEDVLHSVYSPTAKVLAMPDVFQKLDDLDASKQAMIAERLENRAAMPAFVAVRDAYFNEIGVESAKEVLELGCGTGAVCRVIARWPGFRGRVTGSDLSQALIDKARRLTSEAGIDDIEYVHADGQGSDAHAGQYDLVIAHTVISHVADPDAFLQEAFRLVRPGGRVVIHDGDYASMTFESGAPEYDRSLPAKYFDAIVANPFVMREMPRRLRRLGLEASQTIGAVVLEAGTGEYFPSLIRNYSPIAVAVGSVREDEAAGWVAALDHAIEARSFFGSCNFVTYVCELQRR